MRQTHKQMKESLIQSLIYSVYIYIDNTTGCERLNDDEMDDTLKWIRATSVQ